MSIVHLDAATEHGRDLLGGKAWSIAQMLRLGIPVPPAFAITTDVCGRFYEAGARVPGDILDALPAAMAELEAVTGRTFGRGPRPLLVSVRSGASASMPGMMDTILNLGMTEAVEQALAAAAGDHAYAADTRRRFEEQYEHVVGSAAPAEPWEQLAGAISAVFASWRSERAIAYRADRGLPEEGGTAVTVQAMVFGNLDDTSGTGVLFSRDPLGGGSDPYGEWLPRGQGEDVVSGRHDPLPLNTLADQLPDAYAQLLAAMRRLEVEHRDVQDIEFTVEGGRLWLLQTRNAKRSPLAAVRLAVAFEEEGLISRGEALDRVTREHVTTMLQPHLDPAARAAAAPVAAGRPACPGIARGVVVTDVDEAEERALAGESIILGRPITTPDDVQAMVAVAGIVTEVGGSTSHAAVVSRELGVPCVVGCGAGVLAGLDGREVTLDATAGELFDGALPVQQATEDGHPDLQRLAAWAREELGLGRGESEPLPALLKARAQRAATPAG